MAIVINGVKIDGTTITVKNNKIIVDGKDVTPKTKEVNIVVEGSIDTLSVDEAVLVTVIGDAGSVSTMSGDIDIKGDVKGSVSTMSGDVSARDIVGKISTMSGDINKI